MNFQCQDGPKWWKIHRGGSTVAGGPGLVGERKSLQGRLRHKSLDFLSCDSEHALQPCGCGGSKHRRPHRHRALHMGAVWDVDISSVM